MLLAAEWRSGGEVEQGPANASQLRRCAELFGRRRRPRQLRGLARGEERFAEISEMRRDATRHSTRPHCTRLCSTPALTGVAASAARDRLAAHGREAVATPRAELRARGRPLRRRRRAHCTASLARGRNGPQDAFCVRRPLLLRRPAARRVEWRSGAVGGVHGAIRPQLPRRSARGVRVRQASGRAAQPREPGVWDGEPVLCLHALPRRRALHCERVSLGLGPRRLPLVRTPRAAAAGRVRQHGAAPNASRVRPLRERAAANHLLVGGVRPRELLVCRERGAGQQCAKGPQDGSTSHARDRIASSPALCALEMRLPRY